MPATLTYILENPGRYLIFTDLKSIDKLFGEMELPNVESYCDEKPFKNTKDTLIHYPRFSVYKRKMLANVKGYNIEKILFFHDGFSYSANWLMTKLCKETQVLFWPISLSIDQLSGKKHRPIKYVIRDFVTWIEWRYPNKTRHTKANTWLPFMKKTFYKRIGAVEIEKKINFDLIYSNSDKLFPQIKQYEDRIVLLENERVGTLINEDDYTSQINSLIQRFGKDTFVFKSHPDHESCYGLEKDCDKLPNHITADLIINRFKAYIGYSSTVLATAANQGIPSYSLLKMLPTTDVSKRNGLIYYLDSLSDKVIYPERMEELFKMLTI